MKDDSDLEKRLLSVIISLFVLDIACRINLIKTAATQIVRDNHICDCVEHELNVICVGGAGHVAVNLFCSRFVLRLKLSLDVRSRLAVLLCS